MAPTQFVRQCLTFWKLKENFPHINQIRSAKAFSKFQTKITGKAIQELININRFILAILFVFNNMPSYLPLSFYQNFVNRRTNL